MLFLAGKSWSGEVVSLDADRAAARLLEVSHLSGAAAARSEGARLSIESADALRLPSVALQASASRRSSVPEFRLPITLPGGGEAPLLAPDIETVWSTGLRLQQPLWAGGAIDAGRRAARDEAAGAEARRDETRSGLVLAAKESYWAAVRGVAGLEVARAQQGRAARLLDDTEALAAAGMAVRADVAAAKERLASATLLLVRSETASARALAELRSLLDIPPGDGVELADSLASPLPDSPPPLDELLSKAMAARSELAASEAAIDAARAREALVSAPGRPALSLVGQLDYARPNNRYFPVADEAKDSWSVGLVASWTLFDGGKARKDAAAARAAGRAAEEERSELTRRIALEVETRRMLAASARAEVEAAAAARTSAEARLEGARERREAGLAPISEVLDAENALAAAEQAEIEARASVWLAAARLDRAVGR
jgi:outer membrane protein TolC